MKKLKEYLELLDEEIMSTVAEEIKNGLCRQNEYDLHVLLENRKHVTELLMDKAADANKATEVKKA